MIILSIIFVGVILISLLITQQNNNTALLHEETPKNTLSTDYLPPQPLPKTTAPAPLPFIKSRIIIIKAPPKNPKYKVHSVRAENSVKTVASTASKNNSSNNTRYENTQAGITKIGKHPTPKEA